MVWYPLGRPVGTTIYPGMQFTAVWMKRYILNDWSLNDVCCYIPAWFGAIASVMVGLIAYECSIPVNSSSNLLQWPRALPHIHNALEEFLSPLIEEAMRPSVAELSFFIHSQRSELDTIEAAFNVYY